MINLLLLFQENKTTFVNLYSLYTMTFSIVNEIAAFTQGFHDLVPRRYLQLFSAEDLENIMCGEPIIDVDDWRAHSDCGTDQDQVIDWFWEVVGEFAKQGKMAFKLLHFWTAYQRVPYGGFKSFNSTLKLSLCTVSPVDSLPRAQTCFYTLKLPSLIWFRESRMNRPNQEILVPDWLMNSHMTYMTSSDWLFTCVGRFLI
eukprot:sb/3470712/